MARIDWLIINGYLRIEYDYRLPMLVYTRKGWEIERETYTAEMLAKLDQRITNNDPDENFKWLNEIHREVSLGLLDAVEASGYLKTANMSRPWSGGLARRSERCEQGSATFCMLCRLPIKKKTVPWSLRQSIF